MEQQVLSIFVDFFQRAKQVLPRTEPYLKVQMNQRIVLPKGDLLLAVQPKRPVVL